MKQARKPRKGTILLIDDDPVVRLLFHRQLLEKYDLQVVEAPNGTEALSKLEDSEFDLIVSDNRMPGLDGLTLIARLREHPAARLTPIIFLTGDRDQSVIDAALALGADHWLGKPYAVESLCRIFDGYFKRR